MKKYLWHGTWEENLDNIFRLGYIDNTLQSDNTKAMDEILIRATGKNPRANCIYLSMDSESAEAYDYAFKIKIEKLVYATLLVGDFNLIDRIYMLMNTINANPNEIVLLANQYVNTMVTYQEYMMQKKTKYRHYFPEVMYFTKIPVSRRDLD